MRNARRDTARAPDFVSILAMSPPGVPCLLELEVFDGPGIGVALDQAQARLLHPGAHRADEGLLEEGCHEHMIGDRSLDLMELGLPLLAVLLAGLALEEILQLGEKAVRV